MASRWYEHMLKAEGRYVRSSKKNYASSISSVMKEIYAEDSALRREAAMHVKRKIAAKIKRRHVSLPGDPPGRNTGNFLKGLTMQNKKTVALVGFKRPAYHAHLLEFGTKNMKARPVLFPTFAEESATVQKILSGQRLKD